MAPMRATFGVEAVHEPERRAPARRGVARPERAGLEIGATTPQFDNGSAPDIPFATTTDSANPVQ